MAKALVTQERVFDAAHTLVDRGTEPTILTVQAEIGGGSYTTVKRYLDQWKEAAPKRRERVELPEGAVDRLMSLGRDFWGLLGDQAAQQIEAIRAATGGEIAAIQMQLDQAEQAIARLEAEKEQLEQTAAERDKTIQAHARERQAQSERAAAAEAKAGELTARVADLKAELAHIHADLKAERQSAETARTEAKAAAVDAAKLQGELTALREKVDKKA